MRALAALLVLGLAGPAGAAPPSWVVFLADDMGFSDLSSYGGETPTPTIDAIGAQGIRFSQFYATPRCSPTRAALLTGLHPHAAGVGHLADFVTDSPAYRGAVAADVPTLPERLAPAGYRSYAVGKWHLDPANDPASDDAPLARGFERYFGVMRGADDLYRPVSLARDRARLPPPTGDFYLTEELAREAANAIRQHAAETPDQPFFLYVAFTAPHWPVQAPEADRARVGDRYAAGWDRVRARRHDRLRQLGVLPGSFRPAPRQGRVPPFDDAENQAWQAARMRAYAGMLVAMDRAVARVLEALDAAGLADDTVVAFLSDNGASPEELSPASAWLRRVFGLTTWDNYGDEPSLAPGGPDSFQSVGRAWSGVSNAPFRGHKAGLREGGIASPLLVRWPNGLRTEPAIWLREPAHVVDLAATALDLAGVGDSALDGESLAPLFAGGSRQRGPIFWEHEGWRAVLDGPLKAIAPWRSGWELYDLAADRTERVDLAEDRPEELARLIALHDEWAERVGVEPWPWVLPAARTARNAVLALAIVLALGSLWLLRRRRRR